MFWLGHCHAIPHPFEVVIHLTAYHLTLCSLDTDRIIKQVQRRKECKQLLSWLMKSTFEDYTCNLIFILGGQVQIYCPKKNGLQRLKSSSMISWKRNVVSQHVWLSTHAIKIEKRYPSVLFSFLLCMLYKLDNMLVLAASTHWL